VGRSSRIPTISGGTETVSAGGIVTGETEFVGTGGTLSVAGTEGIGLTVGGFAATDVIDLANFAASGATLSFVQAPAAARGTLTITDGALTATITLFGIYVATGFELSAAGAGTAITYSSATAAHTDLAASHI
jgi:hypothetical protein